MSGESWLLTVWLSCWALYCTWFLFRYHDVIDTHFDWFKVALYLIASIVLWPVGFKLAVDGGRELK